MTDLCEDEQAEQICNTMLDRALQVNKNSIEALYGIANLRYIQQQYDASEQYCIHAYMNTVQLYEQQSTTDTIHNTVIATGTISYELRVNICKLLIEHEHYKYALNLLESQLLNECDMYIEILHLTAVCYAALHNYTTAIQYIQQCYKYIKKLDSTERPVEIMNALKQLKLHCQQCITEGKQQDTVDSDGEGETEENNVTMNLT